MEVEKKKRIKSIPNEIENMGKGDDKWQFFDFAMPVYLFSTSIKRHSHRSERKIEHEFNMNVKCAEMAKESRT